MTLARPIAMVAVLAVLAVTGVRVVAARRSGTGPNHGRGDVPPVEMTTPAGYHLVYELSGPGVAVGTEQLWVQRPFESVDETRSGAPPGAAINLTTVNRLGHQVLRAGSAEVTVLSGPVIPAPVDIRMGPVLDAAVRSHRLVAMGGATVAGRRCALLRSAGSLRGGPLAVLSSTTSYVDTCVDSEGLVLEERTVHDGHEVGLRRAVTVESGAAAAASPEYGLTGPLTPDDQGGGAIRALTLSSVPPGQSWQMQATPPGFEGFHNTGRYAVVPPQPQAFSGPGMAPTGSDLGSPSLVVAIDDVYERGPDALVVEQGETMNGGAFAPPTGGDNVDLGALGQGQLQLAATASVVTAEPSGHFVRVVGTVSPDLLVAVARSLVPVSGGADTLVTVPGAVP